MNVLIIAAHPDDEVLGIGGTIARHAAAGDGVDIMIVAQGATSRQDGDAGDVGLLREAAIKAAQILGARPPLFLGLPDNRLDSVDLLDVVQAIEKAADAIKPDVVYTHHGGDLNLDHQIVHRASVTAFRPLPGSTVKSIYAFETPSSTEWTSPSIGTAFRPNRFINITQTMVDKLKALDCYHMEMRKFPHPRSIEAVKILASLRGSHVGVEAAEALEVILEID